MCKRPDVLLTGDYQTGEFQDAIGWLNERANVACDPELAAAARHLATAAADPLLLVIAQSYPDQFSALQVEQLHRCSPLSRIVALLGSWCEGEFRSGRPWPGVMRLYWHQFAARLARPFDRGSWDSGVLLPRTSTVAEQSSDFDPVEKNQNEGLIAVRTTRYSGFDALAESLRQVGYGTVWLRHRRWRDVRGAIAVVWDGGHCDWSQQADLEEVSALSRIAPVIALLDFPRQQDIALIRRAGASAIVSRPFLIDDLLFQINRLNKLSSILDVA